MELTKSGNIKIEINPERHYQGQFIGHEYYSRSDLDRAFGALDWEDIDPEGYDDLGICNRNDFMIQHHCTPFRKVGYIVE